jgi:hypothetical protein
MEKVFSIILVLLALIIQIYANLESVLFLLNLSMLCMWIYAMINGLKD